MTLKLEIIKLECESIEEFVKKVNKRLKELDVSVSDVQIISNDYRPEVFAIIKCNVRYETKPEVDDIIWKYKTISSADIDMVTGQCSVSKEEAEQALRKCKGDLAKTIIYLTEKDSKTKGETGQ